MRLFNAGRWGMYSGLGNRQVEPGRMTPDVYSLAKWRDSTFGRMGPFKVVLSDEDLSVIEWLLDSHESAVSAMSGDGFRRSERHERCMDRVSRLIKGRRSARQAAESEVRMAEESRRAAIEAESNKVDETGAVVAGARSGGKAAAGDATVPELHPEMTSDVGKILANNMAIREMAARDGVVPVVVAGSTKVSHNPADYRGMDRPGGGGNA